MEAGSSPGCTEELGRAGEPGRAEEPGWAVVIAGHAPVGQVQRCLDSVGPAKTVVHVAGNPPPPVAPGVTPLDLGEHLGRPAAVNRAVAALAADVEFVLVTEPGVTWDEGAVEALLAAARAAPRAGALVPRLRGATVAVLPGGRLLSRLVDADGDPAVPGPAVLLRRAALASTGGWDARLPVPYADLDLADRLDAAGWLRVAVPGAGAVRDAVGDIPESADERHAGARRLVRGRTRGARRAVAGAVLVAHRVFGPRARGPVA